MVNSAHSGFVPAGTASDPHHRTVVRVAYLTAWGLGAAPNRWVA